VTGDNTVTCPHCGETIRRDALSCRHCGSDDNTGWSQATNYDGVDLPEEGDYEEGLEREGFSQPKNGGRNWVMAAISLVLVFLFAFWMLRALW
jgi:uncharacterized membrane protein YvbJ